MRHHGGGDTILGRVLDSAFQDSRAIGNAVQRQHIQVDEIADDVKRDDHARTERKRKRQIAIGILHFAGRECHVIPGIGGKQRSHLRHRQNRQRTYQDYRSADSHLHRVLRPESSMVPEVAMEIGGQRLRIPSDEQAEQGQPQQRRNFGERENILNQRSGLQSENVDHRERNHDQNCYQILRVQPDIHIAQNHGSDPNRRYSPEMQNPIRRRNGWNENTQKLAEGHAHCGNRSRLYNQEQRPTVQESPKRAQRLAQVDVLPAGSGHHGSQFAVAQSPDNGHEARHQPSRNQQRRRIHLAGYFGRNNEDTRADHRAHDQHGCAGQTKGLHQFFVLVAMDFPVAGGRE